MLLTPRHESLIDSRACLGEMDQNFSLVLSNTVIISKYRENSSNLKFDSIDSLWKIRILNIEMLFATFSIFSLYVILSFKNLICIIY